MNPLLLVVLFVVSAVLGSVSIRNVPALLHTPLMSGMNALSGVTVLGAIIAAFDSKGWLALALALAVAVLAMINGEGADIVMEAGCGLAVPAGASEALADAVCKMAKMNCSELLEMGKKGKKYCEENFTFEKNMNVLEELI